MPTFIQELITGFEGYVLEEGGPNGSIQALYEHGQHPKYLIFACADSRVHPEKVCGLKTGDDFDMRWGGPFLPAYDPNDTFAGMVSDHIDLFLGKGIREIAVLGHEDCAAAGNVSETKEKPANTLQKIGIPFLDAAKAATNDHSSIGLHRAVERQVAITNLVHLHTYPGVINAVAQGQIHTHGLMFTMSEQVLEKYYPEENKFRVIAKRPNIEQEMRTGLE